ncbi:MAG: AAA family ATPase [bacterium]
MTNENKTLFIAATRQNDGKTLVSLGLYQALSENLSNLGYMKPIGQEYKMMENKKIDKDAVLFQKVFKLNDDLEHINPIAVEKGFTKTAILNNNKENLKKKIINAKDALLKKHSHLLIEGTGHAGVGSVLELSNATTAKTLKAKTLLVTLAGIGRSIDEIMLNKALFDLEKAPVKGIIINKVNQGQLQKIKPALETFFSNKGLKIYGYIPYIDDLMKPTIGSIFESFNVNILSGEEKLLNKIDHVIIGDMNPHDIFDALMENTLLIVPSNREGLIMTALLDKINRKDKNKYLSGIIFTGNERPKSDVIKIIKETNTPSVFIKKSSYKVTKKINTLLIKLKHEESEKIETIKNLVKKYVNINEIIKDFYNIETTCSK